MFKKLKGFIGRKRYSIFFSLLLVVFSLVSFWHSLRTGQVVVIGDSEAFNWPFRILRICIYIILGGLIYFKLRQSQKRFFGTLLVFAILVYELVVVFDFFGFITDLFGTVDDAKFLANGLGG